VVAGRFAGTPLDALDPPTLISLLGEFDAESQSLLAAYLDRRSPRWREDAQTGGAAGEVGAARYGKMTEEEAYQILGLEPGASMEEIGRAHRVLMKKLHPDQGGRRTLRLASIRPRTFCFAAIVDTPRHSKHAHANRLHSTRCGSCIHATITLPGRNYAKTLNAWLSR
jgi:hypothetical protein